MKTESDIDSPSWTAASPSSSAQSLGYDILTEIFENLNDPIDGPPSPRLRSKQQLYRAALTCKAFRDPALDALWKYMDTITPLLQMLPAVEIINNTYTLCEEIQDADLQRFTSYSKKIRVFALQNHLPSISPFALSRMTLLPSLKKLICVSLNFLMMPATPFLLSPTLETVELRDISVNHTNVRPFMYAMQQIVPDLKYFVIRGPSSPQTWEHLLQFRHLCSLELSGIVDLPLFRQLSALPELRGLVIDMQSSPPLLARPQSAANMMIAFSQLRTLSITGNLFTIASYLEHMHGGQITNVLIKSQSEQSPSQSRSPQQDQWSLCTHVIATQWAQTLRSLSLKTSNPDRVQLQTTPDFYVSMSKLCLESLYIDGRFSTPQCTELAPLIQTVQDLRIYFVDCPEKKSFRVLHTFSTCCPHLTKLELRLSSYTTPPRSYGFMSSHGLKVLVIGSDDTPHLPNLHHVLKVSRLLHNLFPYLEAIQTKEGSGSAGFWEHVYEMIKAFQEVGETTCGQAETVARRPKRRKWRK
ncbi:hypothetical protein DXG01_003391 [Tephrocybe rancida]|nr:hypothetical protein DXG01_003391 [Tephrocybe rancida]